VAYTQKHTFFFGGGLKAWTESFYIRAVSQSIPAGLLVAQQLAPSRAACLGSGLFIHAIRIQQVENEAGAEVVRVGDNFQDQRYNAPASPTASHPDISLLIDCVSTGNQKHKLVYMGGIWRTIVDNFGAYTPNGTWDEKFNDWSTKLAALQYGWRSRTPSTAVNITGYTVDAEGFVEIETDGTPFAAITDTTFTVNIRGLPTIGKPSPLNGERVVKKTAANKCKTVESFAVLPFAGVGFLNTFTYGFTAIAAARPEKVVSRERGAPLLQSPGRR
jgi:hypothetical protein